MSTGVVERVDAGTLERQLRELWKQMASKTQAAGEEPVTRACVHNLVIYAPGEDSESSIAPLVTDLLVEQPGRVLLLLSDSRTHRDTLTGWVNAQCHRTSGQRQQVCSEQIIVRAGEQSMESLPSLVIPLLVPDLPVFFWWRADLTESWIQFKELMEHADRVILDSARFANPLESLRRVISIIQTEGVDISFSDLNWSRISPWRQMISDFFDHISCRKALHSVSTIDIQAYNPSGVSLQALLLTSWLAARLKWKPVSKNENTYLLQDGDHQVRVRIFVRPPVAGAARGIAAVTLHTDVPPVTFHMSLDAGTRYLRGTVEMQGARPADTSVRLGAGAQDERLGAELEILGRDRIYEEALALLSSVL